MQFPKDFVFQSLAGLSRTLLLLFLIAGCKNIQVENATTDFREPRKLAKLTNPKLSEISGIAASAANPGSFWVHNDSGGDPEVYLIDENLQILLTCRLDGLENRDWEDIAVGPGPEKGKTYVYVGEIGDNNAKYRYKHIYRFEEPKRESGSLRLTISEYDTITFTLPDKKKDTETLLIDPVTSDLFVISKREKPVWLYKLRYPHSTRDTLVAEKLLSLPFTQIVGGDISPDGKKILLKNYEHVYYWSGPDHKPLNERLQESHFEVPYEIEPQGEAIGWSRDGRGFYTISEKNFGKDTYLYFYKKRAEKKPVVLSH